MQKTRYEKGNGGASLLDKEIYFFYTILLTAL